LERRDRSRYAAAGVTRSSMQATSRPSISLGIASCVDNEMGREFFPNWHEKRDVAQCRAISETTMIIDHPLDAAPLHGSIQ
jgi:hypothetical protein